jgi:predicted NAD/FAD-dependent oxidoreductase
MADKASSSDLPVVVIGAGMAGLSCATVLAAAGIDAVVVDKGRGVGGRMATRRVGDATADHGAQYFTARSDRFVDMVRQWADAGVVRPWFVDAGEPVWCGVPTMTAVPKYLAAGLDVRVGWTVTAVSLVAGTPDSPGHWQVDAITSDGPCRLEASAVVMTAPVPQTRAMLAAGEVVLAPGAAQRLDVVSYDPCVAVVVVPDVAGGSPDGPIAGWWRPGDGPVSWVADNAAKGSSSQASFTVHLDVATSVLLFDADDDQVVATVAGTGDLAWLCLDDPATTVQVMRWRYARVSVADVGPVLVAAEAQSGPVVVAGDGFAGPRVEGAVLSGLAAGDLLAAQR